MSLTYPASTYTAVTSIAHQCAYSSLAQIYLTPCPVPEDKSFEPRWTDRDLYDTSGHPHPGDVLQTGMNDCWVANDLAALALKQPHLIQDAIRYDAASGSFHVLVKGIDGIALRSVEVTQADVAAGIERRGASTVDDRRCASEGALWPAVIEAAVAKVSPGIPQGRVNISAGFDQIDKGGLAGTVMLMLTGKEPLLVNFDPITFQDPVPAPASSGAPTAGDVQVGAVPKSIALQSVYNILERALSADLPVVLGTGHEPPGAAQGDDLMDHHTYLVTGVHTSTDGELWVELHNSLGHNRLQPDKPCIDWERHVPPDDEGCNDYSSDTRVKLSTLYESGSIDNIPGLPAYGFTIGQP